MAEPKILVVDDTPTNLEVVMDTLSSKHYALAVAMSGERALKLVETNIPDLILLDVQMPGLNGFETCRQIKANPNTAHIPIIFLTALSDTDSIVKGFSLGAVDYISKPFQEAVLLARVQTHLRLQAFNQSLEQQVVERTHALEATTMQLQQTLDEVQQSQNLLMQIINTIPQVIFWKDRQSAYLGCNQKFAEMAGVGSPQNIIGKTDYDLPWMEEESNWFRDCDRRVMESNQAKLHIVEPQRQLDGTTLWLDTCKMPLCDETGEVYGILGCFEDISERINLEEERTKAEDALRQKSNALEETLNALKNTQLQLVQHEKMSALGNLVAGVAHEINNPLGFVSGNISELQLSFNDVTDCLQSYRDTFPNPGEDIQELMEDTEIDFVLEDFPKMLESMKAGCDRIQGISDSLRIFSRADTESKIKANIHEGIDSTILILKYRLKAKDFRPAIQVICDYADVPEINCFPGQLNQVFMNILANAIDMFDEMAENQAMEMLKAHPQKIMIQTKRIGEKGVEIRISDNGKGMSNEVCSRIFDREFTTKKVGKGTGLGLAIATQVITEKHGGKLEVESNAGTGTSFVINLAL